MTATVTIEDPSGNKIADDCEVVSLETVSVANKIPYVTLVLGINNNHFATSGLAMLQLGNSLLIKLQDDWEFKGLVTSHNIRSAVGGGSLLVVEVKDECCKLDTSRGSAVYLEQSTEQVIKTILSRNAVGIGEIDNQEGKGSLVQCQCSDWDFLLMRADVNELIVMVDNGKLSAKKVDLSSGTKHDFNYGSSDHLAFEMNANIGKQFGGITAQYWDQQTQKVPAAQAAEPMVLSQGAQLDFSQITAKTNHQTAHLSAMVAGTTLQSKAWANSAMQKDRLAMFRGTLTLPGNTKIKLGDLINIQGVGELFNGTTLITGVRHKVTLNDWQTIVQFGLSSKWYAEQYPDINALPAAGLVPAINGLQVGIVESFMEDDEGKQRLPVRIPALQSNNEAPENEQGLIVWARLCAINAGKEKGLFFQPSEGDEVIVGFINNDPASAIILGGAYSQENQPEQGYGTGENDKRQGIVTQGKLQLAFEDDSQVISLLIPPSKEGEPNSEINLSKDGIRLKDAFENDLTLDSNGISLKDKHGNEIKMSKAGIELISSTDLLFKAAGEFNAKSKKNAKLAGSSVDLAGG